LPVANYVLTQHMLNQSKSGTIENCTATTYRTDLNASFCCKN